MKEKTPEKNGGFDEFGVDLDDRLLMYERMAEQWDGRSSNEIFEEAKSLLGDEALKMLLLLIKDGRVISREERWRHGPLAHLREAIAEALRTTAAPISERARLYTEKQAAEMTGLPKSWIATRRRRGEIEATPKGHYVYYSSEQIERLKAKA